MKRVRGVTLESVLEALRRGDEAAGSVPALASSIDPGEDVMRVRASISLGPAPVHVRFAFSSRHTPWVLDRGTSSRESSPRVEPEP